jgi:predicted TIM-barrel fold metal-dependent hydrolase
LCALVREDDWIEPWWGPLEPAVEGVALFDAHTHTGDTDTDGFHATAAEIVEGLDRVGARAVIFPFHCASGYREENDRVLAESAESGGKLAAFCRVNPRTDDAQREAERALDAGAVGIKLHPRAESFALGDPELRGVIATANERGVPVLVHAGRGIPALGRHALELCGEFENLRLILAHAGISDLSWIWPETRSHPNLMFDTSWWSAADLLALFALVPPGQVVFASDAPYGTPLLGALLTLRCALAAGLEGRQIESVMGGQIARLVSGEEPLDAGPAPGIREVPRDLLLDRTVTFLDSAIGRMFAGEAGEESVALARLASEVPGDDPSAAAFSSIRYLCDSYGRARAASPPDRLFPGAHLIILAACVARTPGVPVPST